MRARYARSFMKCTRVGPTRRCVVCTQTRSGDETSRYWPAHTVHVGPHPSSPGVSSIQCHPVALPCSATCSSTTQCTTPSVLPVSVRSAMEHPNPRLRPNLPPLLLRRHLLPLVTDPAAAAPFRSGPPRRSSRRPVPQPSSFLFLPSLYT